jgi:hypothetical protein
MGHNDYENDGGGGGGGGDDDDNNNNNNNNNNVLQNPQTVPRQVHDSLQCQ